MFCPNCGKEVAQNARFCIHCSTQLTTDVQQPAPVQTPQPQQSAPVQPQQPQPVKKEKKKTPLLISIVVIVAALLIGRMVGGAMVGSNNGGGNSGSSNIGSSNIGSGNSGSSNIGSGNSGSSNSGSGSSGSVASAEYTQIFSDRNIIELPALFAGLDSKSFAYAYSDGNVEKWEFGYKGDTIKEIVATLYMPVAGLTDEDKENLDSDVRLEFSIHESLDFVTVDYLMGNQYYTVTITYSDLDKSENLSTAINTGILSVDEDAESLSMEMTEQDLLSSGYIKR